MTSAADAPRDRDDHNDNPGREHQMDPWADYHGYRDADGLWVITHAERATEWIASSVTWEPPDRVHADD